MLDTRVRMFLLLDHLEYYGVVKTLEDSENLIRDIPSVTLINYIAGFAVNLYLSENSDKTGEIQFVLVDSLLGKCEQKIKEKWVSEVKKQVAKGFMPIMFWNYSNLLFYGIIFSTFNNLPTRDLTGEEAKKVFDACLIINGIANNKIEIETEIIKKAEEEKKIEDVVMPNFMYQRDYASSVDFSNQVTRGVAFFNYLENDQKYKTLVREYYASKNISGYLRMFKNLMVLFSEINIGNDSDKRNQLANLHKYHLSNEVDVDYIETLCVNAEIPGYKQDESFTILRNKFLYKFGEFKYFILDINFLLDQFYKAQIFSFNAFLKNKGVTNDFLSEKGKNFTENIYLPLVLDACFPQYIKFYGDACINSDNEELCDAYLRESNKIAIIEFKDVLLNASVKNSADKDMLFAEMDKKFVANQTNKPKGVKQLINAIKDINDNSVLFDRVVPKNGLEIFPIIVYTDLSFGSEGVNKRFKEKFIAEIRNISFKNVAIRDITFVNLNFFEIREDYFAGGYLNLFQMLDEYHVHTRNPEFELTPFEVFSRFFMNMYVPEELGASSSYLKHQRSIVSA